MRKILRSGATDFTYEREHQPLPRIGPWVEHVDRYLQANEGKAARERLTLIRIYEEVRALGYDGSLSYPGRGSWGIWEPLPALPFMAGSGGGWIVSSWVFEDRFVV